jgi:membrane-associated phospholipid phosphatase
MFLFCLAPYDRVFHFTLLIDSIERAIFGNLPAIFLINLFSGSIFELIIFYSYVGLSLVATLSLLILIFINIRIFRQTFIAFILALIIALPLFVAIPVISPAGLYVAKILKTEKADLVMKQSEIFIKSTNKFQQVFTSKDNSYYAISSIPSLHAAWGLIIVLGIIMTKRKILSGFFSIWLIFNTIGTFYSLQHYALDTIAGIILGLVSFYLAGQLIKIESKYYRGKDYYEIYSLLSEIKDKSIFSLSNLYNKIHKK